jgi:hypothetical protein
VHVTTFVFGLSTLDVISFTFCVADPHGFGAVSDLYFYLSGDPDPDPGSQTDAHPDLNPV